MDPWLSTKNLDGSKKTAKSTALSWLLDASRFFFGSHAQGISRAMTSSPGPVRANLFTIIFAGYVKTNDLLWAAAGATTTGPSLHGVLNLANEESSGLLGSSR